MMTRRTKDGRYLLENWQADFYDECRAEETHETIYCVNHTWDNEPPTDIRDITMAMFSVELNGVTENLCGACLMRYAYDLKPDEVLAARKLVFVKKDSR